ncbi:MAG: hypothetical protein ACK5C0_01615 [Candidatus Kapaibacterium sp.]|jgi:hypothetical protein
MTEKLTIEKIFIDAISIENISLSNLVFRIAFSCIEKGSLEYRCEILLKDLLSLRIDLCQDFIKDSEGNLHFDIIDKKISIVNTDNQTRAYDIFFHSGYSELSVVFSEYSIQNILYIK